MSVKSTLFATRNYIFKIALEGFAYADVLKATKLIMMHGGTVTTEPDEDTVTLSPPNGTSTVDYARFSINWIHDCISANKFVDIMKYILPLLEDNDNTPTVSRELRAGCHGNPNSRARSVEHDITFSPAESTLRTDVSPSPTNTETSEVEGIRSNSVNGSYYKGNFQKKVGSDLTIGVKPPQTPELMEISSDSEGANFGELKSDDKYKQSLSKTAELGTYGDGALHKSERRSVARINYSEKHYTKYSKEENQMMLNYLIENNAVSRAGGISVWREAKAKGVCADCNLKAPRADIYTLKKRENFAPSPRH